MVVGIVGAGILLGGSHYVVSYIETGVIGGNNAGVGSAYAGTPLLEKTRQAEDLRLQWTKNLFDRITFILGKDNYSEPSTGYRSKFWTSVGCLSGSFLLIVQLKRLKKDPQSSKLIFIALLAIFTGLPFSGIFDTKFLQISKISVMNFRYPMQWYPFLVIGGAGFFCLVNSLATGYLNKLKQNVNRAKGIINNRFWIITVNSVFLLSVLLIDYSAWNVVSNKWSLTGTDVFESYFYKPRIEPCENVLKTIPDNKNLLVDWDNVNYYLSRPAIILSTRPNWDIIKARNVAEVEDGFKKRNIGACILPLSLIKGFYDQIPLMAFLDDPQKAQLIVENDTIRAYMIK